MLNIELACTLMQLCTGRNLHLDFTFYNFVFSLCGVIGYLTFHIVAIRIPGWTGKPLRLRNICSALNFCLKLSQIGMCLKVVPIMGPQASFGDAGLSRGFSN